MTNADEKGDEREDLRLLMMRGVEGRQGGGQEYGMWTKMKGRKLRRRRRRRSKGR